MSQVPRTSARRSWRTANNTGMNAPPSRSAMRWSVTLLAIVLICAFVYLIWHALQEDPRTYLGAVTFSSYDPVVVPRMPYVQDDVRQLAELSDPHFVKWNPDQWRPLQESRDIATLAEKLQQLGASEKDVLVIYVAGYGIGDQGKAWMLCSDFMRDQAPSNQRRYEVDQLLEQVSASSAQTKLLVLDPGNLHFDPRLGVLVNEFPRLVEKAVQQRQDPDLWVLLPSGLLQHNAVVHQPRRSLFGRAVVDALSGSANQSPCGNQDRQVSLDELYRYVWNQTAAWFSRDGSAEQTPLLLRGGSGLVHFAEIPPDVTLVTLQPPSADDQKGDQKGDAPESEAAEQGEAAGSDAAKKKPAEPPASSGGKKKAAARSPLRPDVVPVAWRQAGGQTPAGPPTAPGAPATQTPATQPPAGETPSAGIPAADAPAAASEADKAADATAPPAPAATAPAATAPADAPAPAAAPAAAPAEPLDDQQRMLQALAELWQVRDRLLAREQNAWSPVDFAPHLWREIEAVLLNYEQQCLDTTQPKRLASELTTWKLDLERLLEDIQQRRIPRSQPFNRAAVMVRLYDAWRDFEHDTHGARSSFEDARLDVARRASQAARDASFRAADLVLWQAHHTRAQNLPQRSDELLARWFEQLHVLRQTLDSLRGTTLSTADRDQLESEMRRLRDTQQNLLGLWQRAPVGRAVRAGDIQQLEILLATPVLAAEPRVAALEQLLESGPTLAEPSHYETPQLSMPLELAPARWDDIARLVALQLEAVQLADAALADQLRMLHLDDLKRGSDEQRWTALRQLGSKLQTFYQELPGRVQPDAAEYALAVDARDAERVQDDTSAFAKLSILPPPTAPQLAAELRPESLQLELEQPQSAQLQLSAQGISNEPLMLTAQYDTGLMDVRLQGQPLLPQRPMPLSQEMLESGPLALQVQARQYRTESSGDAAAFLVLHIEAAGQKADLRLDCRLPSPNRVDLLVQRVDSTRLPPNGGDAVRLWTFPGRSTSFQCFLVNRSAKTKHVRVQLIAVPALPTAPFAPGRLVGPSGEPYEQARRALFFQSVVEGAEQLRTDVNVVAATASGTAEKPAAQLELPPGKLVPIPLVSLAAAPSSPPAAAADGTAAADPPKPAPADVTAGLACVIQDAEDPGQQWVRWMEITPLAPKNYVREQVGYDARLGQLVVELQLRDDLDGDGQSDRVPGLQELPVEARLEITPPADVEGAAKRVVKLQRSGVSDRLFATVPADGARRRVLVDVDGYPRALIYEVICRVGGSAEAVRNVSQVKLESVLPVFSAEQLERSGSKAPEAPFPIGAEGDKVHVRAPCQAVQVALRVDAPENAFVSQDGTEYIEVKLGNYASRRYYTDRQITTQLLDVAPNGILKLKSDVSDYRTTVSTDGLENIGVDLQARLVSAFEPNPTENWAQLILDAERPVIRQIQVGPGGPGAAATQRRVKFSVFDNLSGVARIETEIFKGLGTPSFEKLEGFQVIDPAQDADWETLVDTEGLKPGRYAILARAVDRVGLVSDVETDYLQVAPPRKEKEKPQEPTFGYIQGVVRFNSADVDRVTVTLEGSGRAAQEGGRFLFKDLPVGKYKLKAKGTFQGRFCEGELEVETSPPAPARQIVLPVTRPK